MTEAEQYKVETLLRTYKFSKSCLEMEINRLYPDYCIKSISIIKFKDDKKIGSVTERLAINNIFLSDKFEQIAQVVKTVSDALDYLTPKEEKIIRARYFDNKSYQKIGKITRQYRNTVSKNIYNKILPKLIEVGILKAWKFFMKEGEENKK